jgi:C-terminal processing protease CtpA/Prc
VYVVSRDTIDEAIRSILPGSEIVEIDGEPVANRLEYMVERVTGSTFQWRDYRCDSRLLRGPADSTIELGLRTPSGKKTTVVVTRPRWRGDDDDEERERRYEIWKDTVTIARSERLEGGWGYVKMTTFSFLGTDSTVRRFDEALDPVIDTPGLIIDLRGNTGGIVSARTAIAGRFLSEETILSYFQIRQPGQEGVYEMLDPRTGDAVMKMPVRAEPREPVYTGPVVILIDRRCFSGCESFSGGLQAVDRALVIGSEPSGGGSGYVAGTRLPSRGIISFSWTVQWLPDGTQVEGNGVRPDIIVRLRPRDFATGRDRVLERAIRALETGEARSIVLSEGGGA